MVQSPFSEANCFAASQGIPHILWNAKFHYCTHKCLSPALSWACPIQSTYPHPTSYRSILIIYTHLRLGLPVVSFSPISPSRSYMPPFLPHTFHMASPSHSYRFFTRTILGELYRSFSSSLCILLHFPFPRLSYVQIFSQHRILKQIQLPFLPQFQWPSFTPIQNNRQN